MSGGARFASSARRLAWQGGLALLLVFGLGLPLLLPLGELLLTPAAWEAWNEGGRLLSLGKNTAILVAGVLLLALPLGFALSFLLFRTSLPGRRILRFLVLLTLFIPLPLLVSGWMAVDAWSTAIGLTGMRAAIVLHSLASLPWVIFLTGVGLGWVERALEEDALTAARPARVLLQVTLPRARLALAATALWLAVQTSSEIGITNLYQVRTYAEEVYLQLVRPDISSPELTAEMLTARALAVSLPSLLLTALVILVGVSWGQARVPPLDSAVKPLVFRLGRMRGPLAILVSLLVVSLIAVPAAGLFWKAGLAGSPLAWSPGAMLEQFSASFHTGVFSIGQSLLLSGWVGVQTTLLALLACWLARDSRPFRILVGGLVVLAFAIPGPIVGLGMKETISRLLELTESDMLARELYYGPSLLPVAWVQTIRLFPVAMVLMWPLVRLLPGQFLETARLEGATPGQEVRRIVFPLVFRGWLLAVVIVAALSLGEISASKLVCTPGAYPFAVKLFMDLHFGVGGDLAARSLMLLAVVAALSGLYALVQKPS
jgi:iron(III) transport system permease protein